MRTKKDKPAAEPLATKVRAVLAQGWHTLDALEALAPGAPSTRRARVHAALEELRLAGMVREERYSKGVAEVRELPPVADGATCPACKAVVREHDDHHGWCGIGIRDCSWWAARGEARDGGAPATGPDHPTLREPSPPVEGEPVDAASYYLGRGREEEDAGDGAAFSPSFEIAPLLPAAPCEQEGEPSATPFDYPPALRRHGPSSRCADCGAAYKRHAESGATKPAPGACPAFKALPRGRPPVARPCDGVAPAAPSPALDAAASEPDACPPCIDCGEERGSCPEGRCRDCDIEHGMSAGACRECHTWIIREDMGGPLAKQHAKGCSLADSDDWHPRNAAEYAAVRTARYGWAPEPRRGCECEFPVVRVAPIIIAAPRPVGRCRPPQCHADDIHEPSRVRSFARPLCERHRRWVEEAGGTLAAGGLAGVLP